MIVVVYKIFNCFIWTDISLVLQLSKFPMSPILFIKIFPYHLHFTDVANFLLDFDCITFKKKKGVHFIFFAKFNLSFSFICGFVNFY